MEVSKKISSRIHVLQGLSLGAHTPNLMSVSFAITELLTFNLQIFMEPRNPDHAPFTPLWQLGVGGHEKTSFEL